MGDDAGRVVYFRMYRIIKRITKSITNLFINLIKIINYLFMSSQVILRIFSLIYHWIILLHSNCIPRFNNCGLEIYHPEEKIYSLHPMLYYNMPHLVLGSFFFGRKE